MLWGHLELGLGTAGVLLDFTRLPDVFMALEVEVVVKFLARLSEHCDPELLR